MCKQYIQPRVVSDHCAIVVKYVSKDWAPKSFKSIDAWYLEPGFKELVQDKWSNYRVQGNNLSKVWNKDVFGCLDTNKKRILKEIEEHDI